MLQNGERHIHKIHKESRPAAIMHYGVEFRSVHINKYALSLYILA